MSHSWNIGETTFIGNSDLSGDITICGPDSSKVHVPGKDLLEFIAEHIKRMKIEEIESQDPEAILGLDLGNSPCNETL